MTVKKSADMPTSPPNSNDIIDEDLREIIKESLIEASLVPSKSELTDMTVDDLKTLIREVVAAELQKWSNKSTITVEPESKDLDNFASKKLYIDAEGKYVLPERTPEEIAQQAQSIRDMFTEWEREYDAEEQRETFAYLQKALRDDFPSEGSFSENPLSVS